MVRVSHQNSANKDMLLFLAEFRNLLKDCPSNYALTDQLIELVKSRNQEDLLVMWHELSPSKTHAKKWLV